MCNHLNFRAEVRVGRIVEDESQPDTPIKYACADIRINCADCGVPFHFRGVDYGFSPNKPMLEVGGLELRAPIAEGEIKTIPQKLHYEVFQDDVIESNTVG